MWSLLSSLKYNAIVQLYLYCNNQEKWSEVPYNQVFMALYLRPDLYPTGNESSVGAAKASFLISNLLSLYPQAVKSIS